MEAENSRSAARNFAWSLLAALCLLCLADWVAGLAGLGRAPVLVTHMAHPVRRWALQPGKGLWSGLPVHINSLGMRGPEQPIQGDAFRVLLLGDSVMFGADVPDGDSPGPALQRELAGRSGKAVQVFNAAVPGYSTVQVLDQLEELLPRLRPQVVVLPLLLAQDASPSDRPDSELLGEPWTRPFRRLLWSTHLGRHYLGQSIPEELPGIGQGYGVGTSMPHRRATRVPLETYRRTLQEAVELCREAEARLVFLRIPTNAGDLYDETPHTVALRQEAAVSGIEMLDLRVAWADRSLLPYYQQNSQHLTVEGHRALARALAERLARP